MVYPNPNYQVMQSAMQQPASYNPYQYPYNTQTFSPVGTSYSPYSYTPTVPRNQNVIWVQGRAGAEAYQMEPGSRAILLDSQSQTFWIKEIGMDGRPLPLMTFKYEAVDFGNQNQSETSSAQAADMSNYVTREDFNKLKSMYEETYKMLEEMTQPNENSNGKSTLR